MPAFGSSVHVRLPDERPPEGLITEELGDREQQVGSEQSSREESTGPPEHPPHPAPEWV